MKRKRCCEIRNESFASDISVYDSNLTAFRMKLLLEVSKGKVMMMSDTPIFSSTDCSLIHTWMAQSKFPIEPIYFDRHDDNSRQRYTEFGVYYLCNDNLMPFYM